MKRILVTFATRAGSTVQVAEMIAETLRASGATVDLKPIKSAGAIEGYDAFVVGSVIRMAQWVPEAVQFVKTNQSTLTTRPTAFFLVSGFLRDNTPDMRKKVQAFLDPVRATVEPKSIGLFAGKMDYSRLSFVDRTIARMVGSTEGDWRDWEAIRGWARELCPIFGL